MFSKKQERHKIWKSKDDCGKGGCAVVDDVDGGGGMVVVYWEVVWVELWVVVWFLISMGDGLDGGDENGGYTWNDWL